MGRAQKLPEVKFKLANVRNPFSRIYSAWNDKLRRGWKHRFYHNGYYRGIKPFVSDFEEDALHNVSFNAFASFVAANEMEILHNWHWVSQYWHCSPCLLKYNYITHLDNNNNETKYLLDLFGVGNLTYVPGQYEKLPGDQAERLKSEDYWKNTPRSLIIDLYRLD